MARYDLYEKECTDVSKSTTSEPKPHGMTGKGYGDQIFSTGDPAYKGIWLHEIYEVESGFKDADGILIPYTVDKYTARQKDYQWKVTTKRKLDLLPGDFIKWHPKHELAEELSVITFEKSETGELILELGARQPDASDAWEANQNVSQGYTNGYMSTSHGDVGASSADFFINDPAHFSAPLGSLTFSVPKDVLNADLFPRITIELDIDLKTDKILKVGGCAVELKKDEAYRQYGNIIGWKPGQEIKPIDVTDWLTADTDNAITIGVYMAEEYSESHAAYSDHPVLSANGTLRFWERNEI